MTDYNALPAGRALDALVAEQVMGIHNPCTLSLDERPNPAFTCECGRNIEHGELPAYSTSIAAAWIILEKHDRWTVELRGGNYYAYLAKENHYAVGEFADTAPLAICRAGLKAVS